MEIANGVTNPKPIASTVAVGCGWSPIQTAFLSVKNVLVTGRDVVIR